MRVGTHAPSAFGSQGFELRQQSPALVEEFLGVVAAQPILQLLQMGWVFAHASQWNLVGAPEAFDFVTVHLLGPRPALWAAQDNHRPTSPGGLAAGACFFLDAPDFLDTGL